MEQELRNNLISTAAELAKRGITEETIGLRAIKDNTFFKRMRSGSGFTVKTYDRLMAWMQEALAEEAA